MIRTRPTNLGTFFTRKSILPAIFLSFMASVGFCGPCGPSVNGDRRPGVNYIPGRCAPYIIEAKEAPVIRSSGQANYLRSCGEAPYQKTAGGAPYQRTCGEANFMRTAGEAHFVKCSGVAPFIKTICDPSGPVRQAPIRSCR
jgi:hypothetical protein